MKTELSAREWACWWVQKGEGGALRTGSRQLAQWDVRTQAGGKAQVTFTWLRVPLSSQIERFTPPNKEMVFSFVKKISSGEV